MKKIIIALSIGLILTLSLNIYQYYRLNITISQGKKQKKELQRRILYLSEKYISKGDDYIGEWRQVEDTNVSFVIKRAGTEKYLVRINNKTEKSDLLCYFDDGAFVIDYDNQQLFFTNGDTLESISKTYLKERR